MRGEQHTVVVTAMANSGDGVGRIQDKVVFIPFSVPGDELLVEITLSKKSFLKAKIVNIIKASVDRIDPRCDYFGRCGGCDWQQLSYEKQLFWKMENLAQTLQRIGKLSDLSTLKKPIPSPNSFNYRNRIQLQKKGLKLQYNRKGTHEKVTIDSCPIAEEEINQFLRAPENWKSLKDGKYEFASFHGSEVGTFKVDEKGRSSLGFRQVNTLQNRVLADRVNEIVDQYQIEKVIDLFCGQGNWGVDLTKRSTDLKCVGIDNNPINIKRAQENSHPRLEFILGDVVEHYSKVASPDSLVLVDPPRSGLPSLFFDSLRSHPAPYFVYISCHPATQARDLKSLLEDHWEILSIEPFDMFPQTSHLESLVLLRSGARSKTAKC